MTISICCLWVGKSRDIILTFELTTTVHQEHVAVNSSEISVKQGDRVGIVETFGEKSPPEGYIKVGLFVKYFSLYIAYSRCGQVIQLDIFLKVP